MHEMSLCEGVLQILEQQALARHFSHVRLVRLAIGALACVEPEAMMFSFDAVTRGTLAEGARLEIIHLPAKAWCPTCTQTVLVEKRFETCPECGNDLLQLKDGDELTVKELEVD